MADDPNVFTAEWKRDLGSARGARVTPAGAARLGAAVFELDPGGQVAPYHAHHANEELLVVLEGTLELRTPKGLRPIGRGAVVSFPTGPEGAHRVRNASGAPARYLVVSTMQWPEVAEYVDTGTVLAMTGPAEGWSFPAGSEQDRRALMAAALEAEPGGAG